MQLKELISIYVADNYSNISQKKKDDYEALLLNFQSYFAEWQNQQRPEDANKIKPPKNPVIYHAGEPVKFTILGRVVDAVIVEDVQQHAWATRFKTWVKISYVDNNGVIHYCSAPSALLGKFPMQ